jgi:cell division protein FtsB
MLALGSLSLQKILLEIFGHYGFSVLMTSLLILLSLSATYARLATWFDPLLKLFLVTIALHFMVSAVVMASSAVDQVFLQKADKERHANMTELHQELQTLSKARPGAPTKAEVAAARAQLQALRDLESDQQQQIDKLRRELASLERELEGMRSEVSMLCRLNPMCDEGESINAKKLETLEQQAELSVAESANELTTAQINELLAYLECAAKQQAGNACTFWGQAYSLVSPAAWKQRLSVVDAQMNRYADNILTLLVSWLAKTIVIPLFFLYSLIHLYKLALRKLFAIENGADPA